MMYKKLCKIRVKTHENENLTDKNSPIETTYNCLKERKGDF